jgi:hypothetical protein
MIKRKLSVLQESNLNSLVKLQTTISSYLSISQLQTTIITLLFQPQTTCLTSLFSPQHHYLTPLSPSSNSTTSTSLSKHSHQLLSAFSLIELSIVIIILNLFASLKPFPQKYSRSLALPYKNMASAKLLEYFCLGGWKNTFGYNRTTLESVFIATKFK